MKTCLYYCCDKKFKPKSKLHMYCCKEHRDACPINKSKISKKGEKYRKGAENKERKSKYMKIYRQVAKEKMRARQKEYLKTLSEGLKERKLRTRKKWRDANKEKRKAWREANKEEQNAYCRRYRAERKKKDGVLNKGRTGRFLKTKTGKEYDLYRERKQNLYNRLFKSETYLNKLEKERKRRMYHKLFKSKKWHSDVLRKSVSSVFRSRAAMKYKDKRSEELLGAKFDEVKAWIEAKWTDGMSWDNYGEWHIDHKIPCSSFDFSDPEQQKSCLHYTNLQPLWAFDNLSKGAKIL
jgi:hypothetical protein